MKRHKTILEYSERRQVHGVQHTNDDSGFGELGTSALPTTSNSSSSDKKPNIVDKTITPSLNNTVRSMQRQLPASFATGSSTLSDLSSLRKRRLQSGSPPPLLTHTDRRDDGLVAKADNSDYSRRANNSRNHCDAPQPHIQQQKPWWNRVPSKEAVNGHTILPSLKREKLNDTGPRPPHPSAEGKTATFFSLLTLSKSAAVRCQPLTTSSYAEKHVDRKQITATEEAVAAHQRTTKKQTIVVIESGDEQNGGDDAEPEIVEIISKLHPSVKHYHRVITGAAAAHKPISTHIKAAAVDANYVSSSAVVSGFNSSNFATTAASSVTFPTRSALFFSDANTTTGLPEQQQHRETDNLTHYLRHNNNNNNYNIPHEAFVNVSSSSSIVVSSARKDSSVAIISGNSSNNELRVADNDNTILQQHFHQNQQLRPALSCASLCTVATSSIGNAPRSPSPKRLRRGFRYLSDVGLQRTEDGHLNYEKDDIINRRFRVLRSLGQGTFGRVICVEDLNAVPSTSCTIPATVAKNSDAGSSQTNNIEPHHHRLMAGAGAAAITSPAHAVELLRSASADTSAGQPNQQAVARVFAMKVVRNVEKYRRAADAEVTILKHLAKRDKHQRSLFVRMLDFFSYHGHMCILFEKLGISVFDFLKRNLYHPYPMQQVRHMSYQLVHAVNFLHKLGITHTDLKPENMLFVVTDYEKVPVWAPGFVDSTAHAGSVYRQMKHSEIRLIDFGSAIFSHEPHGTTVTTRHYRAPEVLLELGWSHPCDVWSISCIIFELFTGLTLFQTHDNREHLAMMERILGPLPTTLAKRTTTTTAQSLFNRQGKLMWDKRTQAAKFVNKNCKPLKEYFMSGGEDVDDLFDLVVTLFEYDATQRITLDRAIEHRFFKKLLPNQMAHRHQCCCTSSSTTITTHPSQLLISSSSSSSTSPSAVHNAAAALPAAVHNNNIARLHHNNSIAKNYTAENNNNNNNNYASSAFVPGANRAFAVPNSKINDNNNHHHNSNYVAIQNYQPLSAHHNHQQQQQLRYYHHAQNDFDEHNSGNGGAGDGIVFVHPAAIVPSAFVAANNTTSQQQRANFFEPNGAAGGVSSLNADMTTWQSLSAALSASSSSSAVAVHQRQQAAAVVAAAAVLPGLLASTNASSGGNRGNGSILTPPCSPNTAAAAAAATVVVAGHAANGTNNMSNNNNNNNGIGNHAAYNVLTNGLYGNNFHDVVAAAAQFLSAGNSQQQQAAASGYYAVHQPQSVMLNTLLSPEDLIAVDSQQQHWNMNMAALMAAAGVGLVSANGMYQQPIYSHNNQAGPSSSAPQLALNSFQIHAPLVAYAKSMTTVSTAVATMPSTNNHQSALLSGRRPALLHDSAAEQQDEQQAIRVFYSSDLQQQAATSSLRSTTTTTTASNLAVSSTTHHRHLQLPARKQLIPNGFAVHPLMPCDNQQMY